MVEKFASNEKTEGIPMRSRSPLSEGLLFARGRGFVNLARIIPVIRYAECR